MHFELIASTPPHRSASMLSVADVRPVVPPNSFPLQYNYRYVTTDLLLIISPLNCKIC